MSFHQAPSRVQSGRLRRRSLLAAGAAAAALPLLPRPGGAADAPQEGRFSLDAVIERARALAAQPYAEPEGTLPDTLQELDYDGYRKIQFRPDQTVWLAEGLPFQLQFFHLGFFFREPVQINLIVDGQAERLDYSASFFLYGDQSLGEFPPDLGFAGFRLLNRMNEPGKFDEVVVFQGASYFRALGQGQRYGLSARGLAIDTGLNRPEEFPLFREFWIERPAADAEAVTIFALMDSPSLAGAYRFVVRPGKATVVEVTSRLFLRASLERLGVAPLTSMFMWGENRRRHTDDFRPEVHDSDGLLLATNQGEWLWRPLKNPTGLETSAFITNDPVGFGLLQRDRAFASYQDLEALYQLRPSAWIEPLGNWGPGRVHLIEIPSDEEYHDNVVAFWTPEAPAEAGQVLAFDYRMLWASELPFPAAARVVATRESASPDPEARRLLIDFGGGPLEALSEDAAVEAVPWASTGRLGPPVLQRNPFDHTWRVFFDLMPEGAADVELRCFLRLGADALTETWSYRWTA